MADVGGVSHMTAVVARPELVTMMRSSAEGADADIVEMCEKLCVAVLDTAVPGVPVVVGFGNGATVAWAQYAGGEA